MAASQRFEDVVLWQKAHAMVLEVYRLTTHFPREELFGLTSQLRRAAVSVPANFAEGFVKRGRGDKLRFYNIAQGSLEECRYYCRLARDLKYADTGDLGRQVEEVSRMLEAYCHSVSVARAKTWSLIGLSASAFTTGYWLLATGSSVHQCL